MKKVRGCFHLVAIIVSAIVLSTGTAQAEKKYSIKGFVGESPTQAASNTTVELLDGSTGTILDDDTTNFFGKYKFSGLVSGAYIVQVGTLRKKVYVEGKNVRLDIDLSAETGTMDYAGHFIQEEQKTSTSATTTSGSGSENVDDASLASQIAGTWWGYSGSTERKIGLCADGTYMDFAESSYSGRSFDSGGNETMAWGSASQAGGNGTWTIQGDTQQGNIYVTYSDGSRMTLNYQQCGELGCLLFNGNKLCRSSGSCND